MNNLDVDDLIMTDEDDYFKCKFNIKVDFQEQKDRMIQELHFAVWNGRQT